MGFRHFWGNPHYNILSEARAAKKMGGSFERNIIIFRDPNFFASPLCNEKPSPLGRAANFLSGIRV